MLAVAPSAMPPTDNPALSHFVADEQYELSIAYTNYKSFGGLTGVHVASCFTV